MELGAFSVSLAVEDLTRSRSFYEKLGFAVTGGNAEHGYLILVNCNTTIGLFQGMFEKNILTFNPGWDGDAQELPALIAGRAGVLRISEHWMLEAESSTGGPRVQS